MAARHTPWAIGLARGFIHAYPWLEDDLISEATYALTDAASRYDPARRVEFRTFARPRVLGALRTLSPKSGVRREVQVISRPIDDPSCEDSPEAEQAEAVERLLSYFPERDRPMLRLFAIGLTPAEVASRMSVKASTVKSRLRRLRDVDGPRLARALECSA